MILLICNNNKKWLLNSSKKQKIPQFYLMNVVEVFHSKGGKQWQKQ